MEAETASPVPYRVLFVCTGNTCRSPMAEAIARSALADLGWRHVEVASAGVSASPGAPASEGAARAARRHGLDLGGHRARQLTPPQVEGADLVLAMGPRHLAGVEEAGGRGKSYLLDGFAAGVTPPRDSMGVPDPFGGSDAEYEATFTLLDTLVRQALRRIAPLVSP